jgi:regulator of protease activity HflC (stomatin/prohibitin superfamily)
MFMTLNIKLGERAVVLKNGLPIRALGPGRHRLWGFGLTFLLWKTDELLLDARSEILAVIPQGWYAEVSLGPRQRGILFRDGRPLRFLRPGVHRFWTLEPSVRFQAFDADQPMPELTDELVAVLPASEYVRALVRQHQRGLLYVRGKLERTLEPGRYAFWTHPEAPVEISVIDVRREQVQLAGQELMTRDKVTLRLTLTAEYAIENPALAESAVTSVRDSVYLIVQLAARQFVSGATLDELLEGRDGMTAFLERETRPQALAFGVRVEKVGVKDVVLPGEMKSLLNRVIEAEKEAAANVILRREETAAMRSLANTARVMADHPVLLRLKELEAMKEIAERIDEVRVVVGADGMKTLLPAELLGRSSTAVAK